MPIFMPADTRAALGEKAEKCESRSLFMDRFARPDAKEEERDGWFKALIGKSPAPVRRQRLAFGPGAMTLYAQLQSRLMVNMAGGVMENAGLCLDRFGLPYIPGSAVKGCARRMAIQQLLEAEELDAKAELLARIALVFGWGETDWTNEKQEGCFKSDFAYAVGEELWAAVSAQAKEKLPQASHFAGVVSFLPAWVVDVAGASLPLPVPVPGKLEMDIVTCHHRKYYGKEMERGVLVMPVALDTEEPNPVKFPAVAAGHVFAFTLVPMRRCSTHLLSAARQWLADGLSQFGLGAKTAAGYGWFNCSNDLQTQVEEFIAKREKDEAEKKKKEAEAAALKAKSEAEKRKKEELKVALSTLPPEQQEDYKVSQMTDDQFRCALDDFLRRPPEQQKAIVRALRLEKSVPGSRRDFWDKLKTKADKGKPAKIAQAIRELSKQMFPGKEGKMP